MFEDILRDNNLCLNFTDLGTDVELIEGGRNIILSPKNIDLYLKKLCSLRDKKKVLDI